MRFELTTFAIANATLSQLSYHPDLLSQLDYHRAFFEGEQELAVLILFPPSFLAIL
jgi:hypothetical protein